jgi:hypothetical protein
MLQALLVAVTCKPPQGASRLEAPCAHMGEHSWAYATCTPRIDSTDSNPIHSQGAPNLSFIVSDVSQQHLHHHTHLSSNNSYATQHGNSSATAKTADATTTWWCTHKDLQLAVQCTPPAPRPLVATLRCWCYARRCRCITCQAQPKLSKQCHATCTVRQAIQRGMRMYYLVMPSKELQPSQMQDSTSRDRYYLSPRATQPNFSTCETV